MTGDRSDTDHGSADAALAMSSIKNAITFTRAMYKVTLC